ncbi:unnamed protein product [Allacma fusca]|uniref:Uncharacterized protein n=1 Tax=Allacma fusca TaxID=39272 RepID=A0A8J2K9C9_9HEXA|nr:unnamed protein product [Allacma fusca]
MHQENIIRVKSRSIMEIQSSTYSTSSVRCSRSRGDASRKHKKYHHRAISNILLQIIQSPALFPRLPNASIMSTSPVKSTHHSRRPHHPLSLPSSNTVHKLHHIPPNLLAKSHSHSGTLKSCLSQQQHHEFQILTKSWYFAQNTRIISLGRAYMEGRDPEEERE